MKPLIYIAGPYTASTTEEIAANVRRAEVAGQQVLEMGLIPVIPHKISSHWDAWGIHVDKPHSWWLDQFCIPLLNRCDAVLFIDGWKQSKGARIEHDHAIKTRKPRYFTLRELEDVAV